VIRRRPRFRLSWRAGRFLALVGAMALVTAAGLHQVRDRYETVRLGYAIDDARFEARRLLEERKRLHLTLAAWKDPDHVRRLARERLGMKEAGASDELRVPVPDEAPRRGGSP
jgi:cell division protein FtsL